MITPRIIIAYYESDKKSWMPFGVERKAKF